MAHLRQRLSVMTQLNGSTSQHQQEADDSLPRQQQRSLRQASRRTDRRRGQQPQPDRSQRQPQLPDLRPRVPAARTPTQARRSQGYSRSSNVLLIIDGLLHITDMSWKRVKHPSELIQIGDEIEVKVLSYDKEKKRVSLGLKQLTPHPWEEVEIKYPI